jgi:uncharacterized protein YcgL (UPF0745 family)
MYPLTLYHIKLLLTGREVPWLHRELFARLTLSSQGIPLQVPPGEEKMFRAAKVEIFLVINRSEVFSCMEGGGVQ